MNRLRLSLAVVVLAAALAACSGGTPTDAGPARAPASRASDAIPGDTTAHTPINTTGTPPTEPLPPPNKDGQILGSGG
jgi:hypothetical protein